VSGTNKTNEAALALKLAAGTQKHLGTAAELFVDGGSITPAQVIANLNEYAALRADVESAKAAYQAKLAVEQKQGAPLRSFYGAYIRFVHVAYDGAPAVLVDFGLAPKKARAPLTTEQRAAVKAKAAATRAARGTLGKKQKLLVKGQVTGVVVTPVTATPPASAPPKGTTTATNAGTAPGVVVAPIAAAPPASPAPVGTVAVVNGVTNAVANGGAH
jgi:hypothetical protein